LGDFVSGAHDVPDLLCQRGDPDPFGARLGRGKCDLDRNVRIADHMHAGSDLLPPNFAIARTVPCVAPGGGVNLEGQIRLLARVGEAKRASQRLHLPSILEFEMRFAGSLRDISPHL